MKANVKERLIGTGIRETTADKYVKDLTTLEKWLKKPVESFTQTDIDKLMVRFSKKIPKRNTQYSSGVARAYLYSIIAYAKAYNLEKILEYAGEAMPKYRPKRPKPIISHPKLFLQEIWVYTPTYGSGKRPINQLRLFRDRMMVMFCYFFACRRGELRIVKESDINWENKMVTIEDVKGGGGKWDEPASSELFWSCLEEYVHIKQNNVSSDWLFPTVSGGQISISSISNLFRLFDEIGEKYGVRDVGFSPHVGRRSRATVVAGRVATREGMHVTRHRSLGAYEKYLKLGLREEERKKLMEDNKLEV